MGYERIITSMIAQLGNLFTFATQYAQFVSIPLFTLLVILWGFRHQQWRPKVEMKWRERIVLRTNTMLLVLGPIASMWVGDWLLAAMICFPLAYIAWIGKTTPHPYKKVVFLLIGVAALGVISWIKPNPITGLLLILMLVGMWELWFRFVDAVKTTQIAWFAALVTTILYYKLKGKKLSESEQSEFQSIERRRQELIPKVLRQSVLILPATFMIFFMIKNLG